MSPSEEYKKCFACSEALDDRYTLTSNNKTSKLLYDAIDFEVASLSTVKRICGKCLRKLTYLSTAKRKKEEFLKVFNSVNKEAISKTKSLKRPWSPTKNEKNCRLKSEGSPSKVKVSL